MVTLNKLTAYRAEKYLLKEFNKYGKTYMPKVKNINIWQHIVPTDEEMKYQSICLLRKEAGLTTTVTQRELNIYVADMIQIAKKEIVTISNTLIQRIASKIEYSQFEKRSEVYSDTSVLVNEHYHFFGVNPKVYHLGALVTDILAKEVPLHIRELAYDILIFSYLNGVIKPLTTYEVISLAHDVELELKNSNIGNLA